MEAYLPAGNILAFLLFFLGPGDTGCSESQFEGVVHLSSAPRGCAMDLPPLRAATTAHEAWTGGALPCVDLQLMLGADAAEGFASGARDCARGAHAAADSAAPQGWSSTVQWRARGCCTPMLSSSRRERCSPPPPPRRVRASLTSRAGMRACADHLPVPALQTRRLSSRACSLAHRGASPRATVRMRMTAPRV